MGSKEHIQEVLSEDVAPQRIRDMFLDYAKHLAKVSVERARALYAILCKATKWVVDLVALLTRKFLSMKRNTRMVIALVFSLSIFFLWQLMAYSVQQTTFVMVNLVMISVVAFAVCHIIINSQRALDAKQAQNDEIARVKEKQERELVKVKAELFEIRNAHKKEDLIKDAADFIKVVTRQRAITPLGSPKYQFLINSINEFYAKSGLGINSAVVYARAEGTDIFRAAGQFALQREPREQISADESLFGQVIKDGKKRQMDVPPEYLVAMSGLGSSSTKSHVLMLPIHVAGQIDAILELCSFNNLTIYDMWEDIDNHLQED